MNRKVVYNSQTLKPRRRELRELQTEAERVLWSYLRSKKLGQKFFRQYSVGPYILDFYCPRYRLAVELDGSRHNLDKNKQYDDYRTRTLAGINIKLIRFWNDEVLIKTNKVLEQIYGHLV